MKNALRHFIASAAGALALGIVALALHGRASQAQNPADAAAATRPADERALIDAAIARGVKFLESAQNPDGSWGTGLETRGTEIYSMVPGSHDAYRVGTSALCVMALREVGERTAHDKGVEYLLGPGGEARRDSGDLLYNTWAHIYMVQALSEELLAKPAPALAERLRKTINWHLDRMGRYEAYTGGWNYYDFHAQTQQPSLEGTSFETAAGLVALDAAKRAGIDIPEKMVGRALRIIEETRLPNGVYLYGADYRYIPNLPANQPRGAVGRTQACNYALLMWHSKRIGEKDALAGLELFKTEHAYLDMGRKRPIPHESWYQTAAYYYYFGHYYTARLLQLLGPEQSAPFRQAVIDGVLPHQEPDGSWWDYAMWDYHKPYGTSFAIMTLLRLR